VYSITRTGYKDDINLPLLSFGLDRTGFKDEPCPFFGLGFSLFSMLNCLYGVVVGFTSKLFLGQSSIGSHVTAYKAHFPPGLANAALLVTMIKPACKSSSLARFIASFERQPRLLNTDQAVVKSPLLWPLN
jgi:hypothetical protein